jgi:hypothetical protein
MRDREYILEIKLTEVNAEFNHFDILDPFNSKSFWGGGKEYSTHMSQQGGISIILPLIF